MSLQFLTISLCDRSLSIDALSMNWNNLPAYAFPSTVLISLQNPSISVQSSSNCSSLASMSFVLRGVTTTSISPNLISILSKLTNTSNGKVSISKLPNSCPSGLGVIKHSSLDKKLPSSFPTSLSYIVIPPTYEVCWGIYSFCFSICPFVWSFVHTFIRLSVTRSKFLRQSL